MTIFKKLLMSAPIMALAFASTGVSAGHHEKGEKMADKAGMSKAKDKMQPAKMKMDEAGVKAKLHEAEHEAEHEADMHESHDDDVEMDEEPE